MKYLFKAINTTMLISDLEEGLHDPHIFKAVFMAGAPGSGKSTIASKLFSDSGLKSLNVDNFWALYKAKGRIGNYEKYWELYKKQEKNFLDGRLGLLIDGTARNPEKMSLVKQSLEDLGYDCAMVFVNTSLEVSQQRVINRAQAVGRHVDPKFVEDTWKQVQAGLGKLQGTFSGNFLIIDNNRPNPNLTYASKAMSRWLNAPPTKHAAKEWIAAQQKARTTQNAIAKNAA